MILPAELLEKLRRAKANGDPKKYMAFVTVEEAHLIASSVAAAESIAAQALRERDEAREALSGLVRQLDAVHADPRYASVWAIAQLHSAPYAGLTYINELDAARRALSEQPDKEVT